MNVVYDSIGIWVPSCDSTGLNYLVFKTHLVELCHGLCAMIKDDLLW